MLPELRPEAIDLIARVKDFIEKECIPSEDIFHKQIEKEKIDGILIQR